ncbi:hypothetical protein Celaphus_00002904 [Cervus elaphus hippelaphus]|uniref:Uncharacterized protein n=1 Tax=Cervus elaphus hippelaphus TaxID=46360 RepID=A0A212D2N4_CEREH|nr:hypothetical protein Celaphus_00002904 [Cervus elaphus hippelaphus]
MAQGVSGKEAYCEHPARFRIADVDGGTILLDQENRVEACVGLPVQSRSPPSPCDAAPFRHQLATLTGSGAASRTSGSAATGQRVRGWPEGLAAVTYSLPRRSETVAALTYLPAGSGGSGAAVTYASERRREAGAARRDDMT